MTASSLVLPMPKVRSPLLSKARRSGTTGLYSKPGITHPDAVFLYIGPPSLPFTNDPSGRLFSAFIKASPKSIRGWPPVEFSSLAEFRYELYKYEVGDKVSITYNRGGKINSVEITLGKNS